MEEAADIADFAGLDDIVDFEGLFDGGFVVPAVNLVEVDVVGLESAEALVKLEEDLFAREALASGAMATPLSLVAMTISRSVWVLRKRPRNSSLEPVE